jgi:hypothetical protein
MAESYLFPKQTIKVIESLKKTFGVDSNAEVISRALSLAQIVAESADDANSVVVVGKDKPVKLTLSD